MNRCPGAVDALVRFRVAREKVIETEILRLKVESSRPRLERILRRWIMSYKYANIGVGTWTPFEDSKFSSELGETVCSKRPENRRFEFMSDKGSAVGSIVIHTCHPNRYYRASTPWGELEVRKSGLTRYDVLQGSILIGTVKEKLTGRTAVVSFPFDREIRFKGWMYSKMQAETETGSVSIVVESGLRSNPGPNQSMRLKSKEFRMLPEEEKKTIVETDHYVQWRISLSGSLHARDDEILRVLALNLCRNRLYSEYVGALA